MKGGRNLKSEFQILIMKLLYHINDYWLIHKFWDFCKAFSQISKNSIAYDETIRKNCCWFACSYSSSNSSDRSWSIKKRSKKVVILAKIAAPELAEKAIEYYINKEIN